MSAQLPDDPFTAATAQDLVAELMEETSARSDVLPPHQAHLVVPEHLGRYILRDMGAKDGPIRSALGPV